MLEPTALISKSTKCFLCVALMLVTPALTHAAKADCEGRLAPSAAALELAEKLRHLQAQSRNASETHNQPSTLGFDATVLILEFTHAGLGGVDDVERALRERDVDMYLFAVHQRDLTNPRAVIRKYKSEEPAEYYIHLADSSAAASEARRMFGITDDATNLENLGGVKVLVFGDVEADRSADVARFVNDLHL